MKPNIEGVKLNKHYHGDFVWGGRGEVKTKCEMKISAFTLKVQE